jgi:signal transduction histidine kinase
MLRTFEVRLSQSGFTVEVEGLDEPAEALVDAEAIARAFSNLLDNAVKYSGASREIRVVLERRERWVVLSVEDRGIGIARDEQEKIFERFHRVGTGLVHDVKGSGLGLALVKHIVDAHAGRVAVSSEPGQGSTFSILLPTDTAAREAAAAESMTPVTP